MSIDHEITSAVERMIAVDLRGRGIQSERALQAMASVPRHLFVPNASLEDAYADRALPTAEGQTISQPYIVALMTELLDVGPQSKVLEIGTGSGYQTAVLATLGAEVVTIEYRGGLSDFAQAMLKKMKLDDRVKFVVGDGTLGYPPEAPYGRVLVTAGAPHLPNALREQLADGGRIVIPIGDRTEQDLIVAWREASGEWRQQRTIGCRFVPLIGADGWPAGE